MEWPLQVTRVGIHQPFLKTSLYHSLVLEIFVYLASFENNTTSDWLNGMYNQSEVVLHSNLQNLGEKDKRIFLRLVGE